MSGATENGFTVSGTWRQQFDWAVVEWNRDNVFEHPAFRYLPDGDLSGLQLSYEETRTNCIGMDSDLYPVVDWPSLRIWATPDEGAEDVYYVNLRDHATPIAGAYHTAYADFTLQGTATGGNIIGIEFLGQHHTYTLYGADTLATAAQAIVDSVNAFSPVMRATLIGSTIRLYFAGSSGGTKSELADSKSGTNGNRVGAYTYASAGSTLSWDIDWANLAHGTSPTKWRVSLNFDGLKDNQTTPRTIPTNRIRKLRWTYSTALQDQPFARSEFAVVVSNWNVTGSGRSQLVAGFGSRRIQSDDRSIAYTASWTKSAGNFSGGNIHLTHASGAAAQAVYRTNQTHSLYLGTRLIPNGGKVDVTVDGALALTQDLALAGEDVLVRRLVGTYGAGTHAVSVAYAGPDGRDLYFDFLEIANPSSELPVPKAEAKITLATDWDTDHSISLPAERTAWMVKSLGFHGRANHYVGALWFYELVRAGHEYASAAVAFSGAPTPSQSISLTIGRSDGPTTTTLSHLIHAGDTSATIARAFAIEINGGYTAIRASVSGSELTIWSRTMGADGNRLTLQGSSTDPAFIVTVPSNSFGGGIDGDWRTDTSASPALNRAARDWSQAYFAALHGYGIDCAAAFSMELQHADPGIAAGLAQRGPAGDPILLPTPAVQTNFSPTSRNFWKRVYADMAALQSAAGHIPYLQFGEVQWWYFPTDGLGGMYSGMPFYDEWTKAEFASRYGRPLTTFTTNSSDPTEHSVDCSFLAQCISDFTTTIIGFVRETNSNARFEVLYPTDVNQTAFNQAINFAAGAWTAANLACLKTESFGFTLNRDLKASATTIGFGPEHGFSRSARSHLVGIGDATTGWRKEVRMAIGAGFESVVLFALDQFCLIGYEVPLKPGMRRGLFMA